MAVSVAVGALLVGGLGLAAYYRTRVAQPPELRFTTTPLLYSPEPGSDLLVVVGHTKSTGFIVALHVLPEGRYRVASYLYLQGDTAPVALAYQPNQKTLYWTSCWKCPGETGRVSARDDHRVVIVQD